MTWSRQGLNTFVNDDIIKKVDIECFKRNCRKIILTQDENGEYHSGAYLVWNKNTTWYLIGGGNPNLRNSGSTSLSMGGYWVSSSVSKVFDFEGSMHEPIERFFRGFNGELTPYYHIMKVIISFFVQIKVMEKIKLF